MALFAIVLLWIRFLRDTPFPDWQTIVQAVDEQRKVRLEDYIGVGVWVGGVVQIVGVCAATALLWLMKGSSPQVRPGLGRRKLGPLFWVALMAVVVAGAALRVPRLSLGYFSDEIYTLRHFVHGELRRPEGSESGDLRRVKWKNTIWDYRRPNNHVVFSVVVHGLSDAWHAVRGDRDGLPPAWYLRLPSLVAGLMSLIVVARMLAGQGLRLAGWCAAAFMAIHPWHLVHGVTLRGYAFVLLLLPLATWALCVALRSGAPRAWVAYAASSFLLLGSNPAMVYPMFFMNLVAAAWLLRGRSGRRWMAWVAANSAAGCLLAPFVAAWFFQAAIYLKHNAPKGGAPDMRWAMDQVSCQLFGHPWFPWAEGHPLAASLIGLWAAHPFRTIVASAILVVSAVAGASILWRRNRLPTALLSAHVVGGGAAVLAGIRGNDHLFLWYLLFVSPALCCCIGTGIAGIASGAARIAPPVWRPSVAVFALAVALGTFALATAEQRGIVRRTAKEPTREVAGAFRRARSADPRTLTVSVWRNVEIYDHRVIAVHAEAELRQWMARARAESRPLILSAPYRPVIRRRQPSLWAAIGQDFEETDLLRGLESENSDYGIYILKR